MTVKTSKPPSRILVAGLGNVLLRDDGVGVHVIHELRKDRLPGVVIAEVGTAVLDALHLFEWADKILAIDAMRACGLPGSMYLLRGDSAAEQGFQSSLHELNLLSVLKFIPRELFPELTVLGIEPETIDFGLDLTPPLFAALPAIALEAENIVNQWRSKGFHAPSRKKPLSKGMVGGAPILF
jgi:hydrogenase maturation protease